MNRLLVVAAAMVAVAGVGGVATIGAAMASKRPRGLEACTSAEARAGVRDAILTRIAAKGGEVDVGYALSLDTPRLESIDYVADRTLCGGTARWSVPEHRRAALDGVSELSDPVRYMIEPGRDGRRMVVALVGGGDRIADWLGAPPAPPAPPPVAPPPIDPVEPPEAPGLEVAAPGTPSEPARPVVERAVEGPSAETRPQRAETRNARTPPPTAREVRASAPREPAPRPTPPRPTPPSATPPPATSGADVRRPAAPRAPSAQTRQLNTGVSATSRLNAPAPRPATPPAAPPAAASPTPASVGRADPPPPPNGPSFDCRRSRNAAERTICGDDRLARMDVAMARRYAEAQDGLDPRDAADLRAEQLDWLRRRDACETRACLETMYQTRAARLDRMY